MLATLALSLALVTSGVEPPGPCDLLTREAASGLLGQQAATPAPSRMRTPAAREPPVSIRPGRAC